MNLTDFTIIDIISRGYSTEILLVRKNGGVDSGMFYAAKCINKQGPKEIVNQYVQNEKEILEAVRDGPFMNRLKYSFEDETQIIHILEFLPVEDLGKILRVRKLEENEIKFYTQEIIIAIEFLHSRGIIHRDLKPENVGLDSNGHIAIIDFGLSKKADPNEIRKKIFRICGTPGYIAPEIRNCVREGHDNSVDWYSMGACLYKLLTGEFANDPEEPSEYPLHFPDGISKELQDLITKLLWENPEERLGGGGRGAGEIKAHPFFKDTDWAKVSAQEIQAPDILWICKNPESSAQMKGYNLPANILSYINGKDCEENNCADLILLTHEDVRKYARAYYEHRENHYRLFYRASIETMFPSHPSLQSHGQRRKNMLKVKNRTKKKENEDDYLSTVAPAKPAVIFLLKMEECSSKSSVIK